MAPSWTYYDINVVSVGAGESVEAASVGTVGSTAGSVAGTAVTVTEAVGAGPERGRSGRRGTTL